MNKDFFWLLVIFIFSLLTLYMSLLYNKLYLLITFTFSISLIFMIIDYYFNKIKKIIDDDDKNGKNLSEKLSEAENHPIIIAAKQRLKK